MKSDTQIAACEPDRTTVCRSLNPNVTDVWHNLTEILIAAGMMTAPLGGGHITENRSKALVRAFDERD
jgi:hypothetical protein